LWKSVSVIDLDLSWQHARAAVVDIMQGPQEYRTHIGNNGEVNTICKEMQQWMSHGDKFSADSVPSGQCGPFLFY